MTSTRTCRLFAAVLIGLFLQSVTAQVSQTFNASGTFNTPAGVNKVVVECWGGGGKGGNRTNLGATGGGGGGAYSRSVVDVTPLTGYTVTVGAGSTTTAAGGDSWFATATTAMAKGGGSVANNTTAGATGGTAAASIGTIKFNGGTGANGIGFVLGGGGGSSAGYGAAGGNGLLNTGGTAPAGGGNGGAGPTSAANGSVGAAPGSGGGGSRRDFSGSFVGGNGTVGRVVVSYYTNGTCISTTTGVNNIVDNGCGTGFTTSVPIEVTGQPTTLGIAPGNAKLFNVKLIVAHTFNSDLRITLTSPGGATRNLVLNKFGNGDNLGNPAACPGTVLTLQDGGTTLPTANTSNVAGTYAPEELLSGFSGDPNGAWTLNICDNAGTDVGRLVYAQLNFCTVPQITLPTTNSPVCSPAAVTLGATVTGSPTPTLLWSGTGTFAPNNTSANVSVTGAASGNYTLTATSSCGSDNTIIPVVVNTPPVVSCPADFGVCSADAVFALTGGSPGGGAYSGTGVSGGNFDPALANVGANLITYNYTDGNGCSSNCTFTITVTAATAWYEDADNDTFGDPGSMQMACAQPLGYVANNTDDCPALSGLNGDLCDDGNPFTSGDAITACACTGTPAPCDTWSLDLTTDANGADISWQVKDANSAFILASGAPVLNNNTVSSSFCVPVGACFELTVNDAGNNGIPGGGWVLRNNNGDVVLDNVGNGGVFTSTCTSPAESFCNPLGTDKLIASHFVQEFFGANDNVYASANPDVSAQWPVSSNANLADDGYQFWFFEPSSGYSRRIFRNHATSGGFGPANAIRATKLALNNIQTNPLPTNTLLNVRVRSRVNGVDSPWGPACRFRIAVDPCPSTKLIDTQNHQNFSCGVQREFGGSDKVHCFPVAGANKYRFRFENANEGYLRNIATNTPTLVLNWVTLPLVNGGIYDVQVQASFDGGTTYCPLGDVCVVNILNVPAQNGRAMETTEVAALGTERPEVWPNPTADGSFDVRWTVPMVQEGTITLEVLDLNGRTLHQERIAMADGFLQAHITPQQHLSSGVYLMRFTAEGTQHMERLVVR